jgi:hypothetical protein
VCACPACVYLSLMVLHGERLGWFGYHPPCPRTPTGRASPCASPACEYLALNAMIVRPVGPGARVTLARTTP